MLCSDAIFYANFNSDTVEEIFMHQGSTKKAASKFTSIDMI